MASIDTSPMQNRSVPEAAKLLGVSEWTVGQLIRRGELASLKIGARRLIPETAIAEYVSERLERSAP